MNTVWMQPSMSITYMKQTKNPMKNNPAQTYQEDKM